MNWELVEKIRSGEYSNMTYNDISKITGVKTDTIKGVKNYISWIR